MPFTDLVHYLNAGRTAKPAGPTTFSTAQGRVLAHFANLQLSSQFLPIVDTTTGRIYGHAAHLQAVSLRHGTPLDPHSVFVLPYDDEEFIYLDRLVRTLHALNYLHHPERSNLLLKVHPRHVLNVPTNHGQVFAALLRTCGLSPQQVTLELEVGGLSSGDPVQRAITNYQAQGYHLAIHRFGRGDPNDALLEQLRPDIVRLDASQLQSPQRLRDIARKTRAIGARLLLEDGATPQSIPHGTGELRQARPEACNTALPQARSEAAMLTPVRPGHAGGWPP